MDKRAVEIVRENLNPPASASDEKIEEASKGTLFGATAELSVAKKDLIEAIFSVLRHKKAPHAKE